MTPTEWTQEAPARELFQNEDLIGVVLSYLTPYEITQMSPACRCLAEYADSKHVWTSQLELAISVASRKVNCLDTSTVFKLAQEVAGSSRTPKHYFFAQVRSCRTFNSGSATLLVAPP
jgi:hypothetical protein